MRRLVIVGLLALANCGGDDGGGVIESTPTTEAETPTPTELKPATTAPDPRAGCTKVEDAMLLEGIKKSEAWAAKAPQDARISRNEPAWYVASRGGALWATNIQPDAKADGGLTLAMNDEARAAIGTAASPDAPAYEGLDVSDPGAVRALECARG